jgi:hypothetical protein
LYFDYTIILVKSQVYNIRIVTDLKTCKRKHSISFEAQEWRGDSQNIQPNKLDNNSLVYKNSQHASCTPLAIKFKKYYN